MPVLRKAEEKAFIKSIISKGYGFHTPQDGSVCKLKIITDEKHVITDLNENNEKEIVVGDVDEPIDRILEDCIRTMKEEEECLLKFVHPCLNDEFFISEDSAEEAANNAPLSEEKSCLESNEMSGSSENESKQDENSVPEKKNPSEQSESECTNNQNEDLENKGESAETIAKTENYEREPKQRKLDIALKDANSNVVEIRFQLLSYTREPEIWEMSITEKWRRASYHKQRGLELYARGAYQYAFRRFGLTLKYVISLEHDIPSGQEEGMDTKGLKLSCYLNVAACQMRHHNYDSVVINSTKALSLQANNAKALYRRGSAYVQLQEYEKAKEDLDMAQKLEPKNQAIAKQQQMLKNQVQKLNQYYASAMKKLFS